MTLVPMSGSRFVAVTLLALVALSCASSSTASAQNVTYIPGPPLNIATFIYANCPAGQVKLNDNYTMPATGINATQAAYIRGYKLWRDTVNNNGFGGLTILGNRSIAVNLTFFCIGSFDAPLNGNDTSLIPGAKALLQRIVAKEFGDYPVFIQNPTASTTMSQELMKICEFGANGASGAPLSAANPACVFIHPLSATTSLFVCGGNNTPNPAECSKRNRRAGARRFDYSWSTFPAEGQTFTPFANLMVNKGYKTIVMLPSALDTFNPASTSVAIANAQSLALEVVLTQYLKSGWKDTDYYNFMANVSTNYAPDAISLTPGSSSANGPICAGIVKAMVALNYMPKLAFLGSCSSVAYNDATVKAGDLFKYWMSTSPWDERLKGTQFRTASQDGLYEPFPATTEDDSPKVFANMMRSRYGTSAVSTTTQMAFGALGAMAALMVHKAAEVNPTVPATVESINYGIRSLSQVSHAGTLQFDQWGRLIPIVFTFLQFGDNQALNLLTPVPGGVDPTVPIPTWAERSYSSDGQADEWDTSEWVVFAITTVANLYAVGLLAGTIYYRKNGVILAATPVFCAFTLIGAITLMSSNYVWMLHENAATCSSKIWLLQLGFTLLFSSMLIKTLRIWAIFKIQKLQVVRISTTFLVAWLGAVLGFDTIYTLVWTLVDPYKPYIVAIDPLRPLYNYTTCRNGDSANNWVIAALIIKFALMGISAWAAFAVRKVPSEFQESTFIGASIWNVTFLMVIGVSVVITSSDRSFSFWVRSLGIVLMCISTISFVFVPKFIKLREGEGTVQSFYRDKAENRTALGMGTKVDDSGPGGNGSNNNAVQRLWLQRLNKAEQLVIRIKHLFPQVASGELATDFNAVLENTNGTPNVHISVQQPQITRGVSGNNDGNGSRNAGGGHSTDGYTKHEGGQAMRAPSNVEMRDSPNHRAINIARAGASNENEASQGSARASTPGGYKLAARGLGNETNRPSLLVNQSNNTLVEPVLPGQAPRSSVGVTEQTATPSGAGNTTNQ